MSNVKESNMIAFLLASKVIAKKTRTSLDQVLKAAEILEMRRANHLTMIAAEDLKTEAPFTFRQIDSYDDVLS